MERREIKFRDYDMDHKVLRYFDLDSYDRQEHNAWGNIMQYTGLKDKSGKEIYEGDIVAIFYVKNGTETDQIYSKFSVKWGIYNIGCNGFEYDMQVVGPYVEDEFLYGYFVNGGVTVIGNIYENPELCNH